MYFHVTELVTLKESKYAASNHSCLASILLVISMNVTITHDIIAKRLLFYHSLSSKRPSSYVGSTINHYPKLLWNNRCTAGVSLPCLGLSVSLSLILCLFPHCLTQGVKWGGIIRKEEVIKLWFIQSVRLQVITYADFTLKAPASGLSLPPLFLLMESIRTWLLGEMGLKSEVSDPPLCS